MFYTYILHNNTIDKYYIGYTSNLDLRLIDHNKANHKTKYTRKQLGKWELVYSEEYKSRSDAMNREKILKSWKSKKALADLISIQNKG